MYWGYTEIVPHNLACQQNKTKRKMHQLKKSDCGLWTRGKFVNTGVLLGLFTQNGLRGCLRLLGIPFRHLQEKCFRPFNVTLLNFSPQ